MLYSRCFHSHNIKRIRKRQYLCLRFKAVILYGTILAMNAQSAVTVCAIIFFTNDFSNDRILQHDRKILTSQANMMFILCVVSLFTVGMGWKNDPYPKKIRVILKFPMVFLRQFLRYFAQRNVHSFSAPIDCVRIGHKIPESLHFTKELFLILTEK